MDLKLSTNQKQNTKSKPIFMQRDVSNSNKRISQSPYKNKNTSPLKSPFFTSPTNLRPALSLKANNKKYWQSLNKMNKQMMIGSVTQQNHEGGQENERVKQSCYQQFKVAIEKDANSREVNLIQAQLAQIYRVIHYYEGKVKQLQAVCRNYERSITFDDNKKTKSQTIQEIIGQFRENNTQLSAQLYQSNAQLIKVTAQLKQMEKYNLTHQLKIQSKTKKQSQKIIQINEIDDYQIKGLASTPKRQRIAKRPLLLNKNKEKSQYARGVQKQFFNRISQQREGVPICKKKESYSSSKDNFTSSCKQKSWIFGNLNSRLNMIEKEVDLLNKQNQKLQAQLNMKTSEVIKLQNLRQELQLKLDLLAKIKGNESFKESNQSVTLPKSRLKQIIKPIPQSQSIQHLLSSAISNLYQNQSSNKVNLGNQGSPMSPIDHKQMNNTSYKFVSISEKTIIKLTLNILRQDITYLNLIEAIVHALVSQDQSSITNTLGNVPYQLSSEECKQFVEEYEQIKKFISSKQPTKDISEGEYKASLFQEIKRILRANIPFYKNITIRRDYTLNIQLSNKFKNYESEYHTIISKYNDQMPYKECEEYLKNSWGLSGEQFLFFTLKNYEEMGSFDFIAISTLGKYFLID